ncbi:unnamed protein product [Blepharisma stoltei]|uniref:Uncharacterized protein n=1 Tax=Blepharisma stoltei TaxID=1481888 RepID=A0AAU9KGE0_9CILI|nr:unnamed protein product [Blepharisma stoltei]
MGCVCTKNKNAIASHQTKSIEEESSRQIRVPTTNVEYAEIPLVTAPKADLIINHQNIPEPNLLFVVEELNANLEESPAHGNFRGIQKLASTDFNYSKDYAPKTVETGDSGDSLNGVMEEIKLIN